MLTGLWVAISPWFITLQYTGGNAAAVNLISGLAVAAAGAFALAGPRGFAGLQSGSALLGVWLIIAGPTSPASTPSPTRCAGPTAGPAGC
jgi:hypothetical protein